MNPRPKYLIIHHDADYDGILSEAVCRHFLSQRGGVTSIGWDYGKPVPLVVPPNDYEQIYMVDISIKEFMHLPNLVWVDHHKTAIDQFDPMLPGYRIDGVAACRLCWQWFTNTIAGDVMSNASYLPEKGDYVARTVTEPLLIRLAGEHDIWDHRDERALILQSGLRELEPEEFDRLVATQFQYADDGLLLEQCLSIGVRAKKSRDRANAATITKIGHDVLWQGLTFLCCNGLSGSQSFEVGIRPHHQALMGWRFDGQTHKATVSLYHAPGHEGIDLSILAKGQGGGGHPGACGFQMSLDQLDFILTPI